MATAQAKKENEKHGLRCVFSDGEKHFYEPLIFNGNPRIAATLANGERYVAIPNVPGCRPYIAGYEPHRFIWNRDFKAEPGELYLSKQETSKALNGSYILVEPTVKGDNQANKDWGWDRWQELVKARLPWVQAGPAGKRLLEGVPFVQTGFRDALGLLAGASLLVTTDGALHHAAAAMGVPAVVIWGGFTSPENLGYDAHINLWSGAEPCGIWKHSCPHCREAMDSITVREVLDKVTEAYEADQRHLAS